jgi:hypothetical protein
MKLGEKLNKPQGIQIPYKSLVGDPRLVTKYLDWKISPIKRITEK